MLLLQFSKYLLCLQACQPHQHFQRVQADPENIKTLHQLQLHQKILAISLKWL